MFITARSLYHDTSNFLRREIITILKLAALTSLFTMILTYLLVPNVNQNILNQINHTTSSLFELVRNMSPQQQNMLLKVSIANTVVALTSNTILFGAMLYTLPLISKGYQIYVLPTMISSLSLFPKLFLQAFFITILVQIGFMIFMLPGMLLTILLSPAPIILVNEKISILKSIQASIYLSYKYIKIITPGVVICLFAKFLLIFLFLSFKIVPINFASMLLHTLGNFISAILIIYLYRMYIVSR